MALITYSPKIDSMSGSQMGAPTAYRYGIIHFRALFSLIRLLPAYRLFRRLRRTNCGLRLGIKLWGLEGFSNSKEDLAEAWEIMEKGFVSLDVGLATLISSGSTSPDRIETYSLPPLDLFGTTYSLGVDFRPEVDFSAEDMESVLSERLVEDMEDMFPPTVAAPSRPTSTGSRPIRRMSATPTGVSAGGSSSPIPPRQQAATPGSFGSVGAGGIRPSTSRVASGTSGSKLQAGSFTSRVRPSLDGSGPSGSPVGAPDKRVSRRPLITVLTSRIRLLQSPGTCQVQAERLWLFAGCRAILRSTHTCLRPRPPRSCDRHPQGVQVHPWGERAPIYLNLVDLSHMLNSPICPRPHLLLARRRHCHSRNSLCFAALPIEGCISLNLPQHQS